MHYSPIILAAFLLTAVFLPASESPAAHSGLHHTGELPEWSLLVSFQKATPATLAAFFLKANPAFPAEQVKRLARIYCEEAAREGVDAAVAFMQMCLETGYLRYGGQVEPWQNNFCGLGALDGGASGAVFSSPRAGVRAHIQHLKAYASQEPVREPLLDPRYHYVKRGSAKTVDELTGRWASDPFYGEKLKKMLIRYQLFR